MIIVIEGADGAGKTTVGEALAKAIDCQCIHFPDDDGVTGVMIREYLRGEWGVYGTDDREPRSIRGAMAFQALQVANRMERMPEIRRCANHKTNHIVLVRYWASGLVYGTLDGLSDEWLRAVHADMPKADLCLLLDVDATEGMARQAKRDGVDLPERYEGKFEFVKKVCEGYRSLWETMGGHPWQVVDANESEASVAIAVYKRAMRVLG